MRIVEPSVELISPRSNDDMMMDIERIGRVCYKSEGKIGNDTSRKFVQSLIKSGHESVLEHGSITAIITCDRGVSHELVRHRIASYSQESTRYCMYNNGLTLVAPSSLDIQCGYYPDEASIVNLLTAMRKSAGSAEARWLYAMHFAEVNYTGLLNCGKSAQDARSVLPNSLKTEIVVTMNLRSWRHFFKLRALGKTGKPHPDMLCIAVMLLNEFADRYPVFFGDIANELPEGLRQPRRNCNTCSHHNTDYCGWCEGKSLWAFN